MFFGINLSKKKTCCLKAAPGADFLQAIHNLAERYGITDEMTKNFLVYNFQKEKTQNGKKTLNDYRRAKAKELIRREKQLGARRNKFYMIYLFMILSLIYITDEMASTISIQFQANIVTEFFVKNMGMEYGAGLSLFSAIGFISYPVTLLIIFYRPLADKFGRKPFLVINTLCMGLGLFLVYLSKNIYVYMIGGTLMGFMVSHDMQCVYILECSDAKSRARNYAIVKAVAILGTLLVPLLRATLMQNVSERWHVVYLVPAIIGFVMSLFALLFARETNAFFD